MPKYLVFGSYTQEGVKGLLKEGGSNRREAVEQAANSVGATLEAYYFAFGENDFYLILDAPDQASIIATSLSASASGAVNIQTVVLITPEEIDQALEKHVDYRPPGH